MLLRIVKVQTRLQKAVSWKILYNIANYKIWNEYTFHEMVILFKRSFKTTPHIIYN